MSDKNCDSHGRARSCTIGFRVSPEESRQIDNAVALSGMTKQDYIVSKLINRKIVVYGNCKVHRAVFDRLSAVLEELKRIESGHELPDELKDDIHLVLSVISGLYKTPQEP